MTDVSLPLVPLSSLSSPQTMYATHARRARPQVREPPLRVRALAAREVARAVRVVGHPGNARGFFSPHTEREEMARGEQGAAGGQILKLPERI